MGSLQQQNRFRPFTQTTQGSFPQSLSGSETDISISNENLSNEEKYVVRHTARQEPQGEENQQASNRSSLRDSLPSNRNSLDVSSSSYNTLIIHSAGDEPWTGRNSGARESIDASNTPNYISSHQQTNLYHDSKLSIIPKRGSASPSPSFKDHSLRNSLEANARNYDNNNVQELTEIPDDYLSQSSVLKHLAKEVNKVQSLRGISENDDEDLTSYITNLPPPPEYPKWVEKSSPQVQTSTNNIMSLEKMALSRSQPDISKIGVSNLPPGGFNGFRRGISVPRPPTKGREENESKNKEAWPSAKMVKLLFQANSDLKVENENRFALRERLEQEILRMQKEQEDFMQQCEQRAELERAVRTRLQSDNRALIELNKNLREEIEKMKKKSQSSDGNTPESYYRRELSKQEVLITQLIQQNKEHVAAKERQEIELAAQRVTLHEQRTHIDILDTALTNAQSNVLRLEEECRLKQVYVERVAQLQRALSSQQLANDRREEAERKLRSQLESELQRTKMVQGEGGKTSWNSSNCSGTESPSELKRRLREKDEKIMRLEGECSKWEQRYLEECALRQAAIDAVKDAQIAALEKTSQDTEKIIAEARNEKIRHMDEVHAAQKKVTDLESRMKDLESKLAERDAMIKVLQKHTYDKDVSSMLGRSPHHTPHASLAGTDIDHVLASTVSREELVSSVLTSSTGFGSSNSYAGSDSSYHHMPSYTKYENKNFDSTKQTLDNQLKEIDSQLLSKRGLCCFPGFTNPVTAQRKGNIPKPLLPSVTGGGVASDSGGGVVGNLYEPSAMLLLEKQGRASQQQRMQEVGTDGDSVMSRCPAPSSLPRPPRSSSHRSGLPRRLGDYNRLQADGDTPIPRKKSDGGDSLSSNASSRRTSPARSLIPPPPKKLGEYGRLSESGGSTASLRKPPRSSRGGSERDSASTLSDNSASSLPTPSKVRLFGGSSMRRGSSLGRDSKSSTDSTTSKYRIQF